MMIILHRANPYLACLAAALFSFYDLFQLSIFNVISAPLMASFHLSTIQLGFFSASFLIANTIGLLLLGLVLDRYSVRTVGLIFLSLATMASFGFAYSSSLFLDVIFRSFQGFASAASLLICIKSMTEWFKQNANLAVGIGIAIAVSGGVVGNIGFAYFVENAGWRDGLNAAGLLGVFILVLMYFWLYDPRDIKNSKVIGNFKTAATDIRNALSNTQNVFAGVYLGLMSAPIFILATLWGNYYLVNLYHTTATKAALFSSLFFVGMILGAPFWGRVADQFLSQIEAMYLGCIIAILICIAIFSGELTLFQVGIAFFALGFFSSVQNLAYVIVSRTNAYNNVSAATALTAVILNAVGAILQPTFGWMLSEVKSVNVGLTLFLPAFCLCLLLIFLLQQRMSYLYNMGRTLRSE